mgnify:CR=1 FL=1
MKFSFYIFQATQYEHGDKYNNISKLISGGGDIILLISVTLYLDGFTAFYNYLKDYLSERKRLAQEAAQAKKIQQQNKDGGDSGSKGKGKKGDMDTQKSIDEISEDDLNFVPRNGDAAVLEGGRQSRPGSQGDPNII